MAVKVAMSGVMFDVVRPLPCKPWDCVLVLKPSSETDPDVAINIKEPSREHLRHLGMMEHIAAAISP